MLYHAAAALDAVNGLGGKGLKASGLRIDWPALIAFKREFTEPVPESAEKGYAENGINAYHGRARFVGPNALRVGEETLEARYVVIAAGAEPVKMPIEGAENLATSTDFMALERLPQKLLFVGGGYVAFEFAHIAARAGAEVTVLHRGGQPLKGFDPDLVGLLVERTRGLGVDLRLNHAVTRVERNGDGFVVHADGDGGKASFRVDLAVHAAGRVPPLDELDPEAGRVEREKGRLKLNDYLQSTSNPAVYAAGDAAQKGPPLTPVASLEAAVVAENLLKGNSLKPDYTGVPGAVFTAPPLAKAGLLEAEAREQGLEFEVRFEDTGGWFTARHAGETCAGYKMLIEKGTDRILGAHLVGPGADEVINLFAVAMRNGLTASELKRSVLVFPTAGHDVGSML